MSILHGTSIVYTGQDHERYDSVSSSRRSLLKNNVFRETGKRTIGVDNLHHEQCQHDRCDNLKLYDDPTANAGVWPVVYGTLCTTPLDAGSKGNVVLSPLGLELMLALLLRGSTEQSEVELATVLCERSTWDIVRQIINTILAGNKHPLRNITLYLTTKIYNSNNFKIENRFKSQARRMFFTNIQAIDFKKPRASTLSDVNAWLDEKSNGGFTEMLSEEDFGADTRLVVFNAMYFKGDWKYRFHPQNIQKETFNITETRKETVEMMVNKQFYGYRRLHDLKARMLVMPYVQESLSCVIILPDTISGINQVEEKLPTLNLIQEIELVTHPEVEVWLPRFKIECTHNFNAELQALGVYNIFNPEKANLRCISRQEGLFVNKVLQKAFVEVNEESSKRDESLLVVPKQISVSMYLKPRLFKVNRPFFFCIANSDVKTILFIGKVRSP